MKTINVEIDWKDIIKALDSMGMIYQDLNEAEAKEGDLLQINKKLTGIVAKIDSNSARIITQAEKNILVSDINGYFAQHHILPESNQFEKYSQMLRKAKMWGPIIKWI